MGKLKNPEVQRFQEALHLILAYSQIHIKYKGINNGEINQINNIANKALYGQWEDLKTEIKTK